VATLVKNGGFAAAPIRLGMQDGTVSFVPNEALFRQLPEDVRRAVADVEARIRSGELSVPRGEF
jgi:basic membrane lipoprotein Med (substrate-binding protein (PBP1-ABC) superfamily)